MLFNHNKMDKKTCDELISICKERKIKGYSNKKKTELIQLINTVINEPVINEPVINEPVINEPAINEPIIQSDSQTNNKLLMIDLFAGTGAFTKAFENTGKVECVFSNDMVEWSKKIYDANFKHSLTLGDLNDIDVETIPKHDILTAGFP